MTAENEWRGVLDSSAMVSYAHGHVHVGELILDIAEEGALVAIPAVALVDAYLRVGRNEAALAMLRLLVSLPAVGVVELGSDEAGEIALTASLVSGDLARAHAVWAAIKFEAYLITAEPQRVPSILTTDQVIDIPADGG